MMEKNWYVYILRCGDGSLYTGIAADVAARLSQHRSGVGAKYTRGRGPLKLVYQEACPDKGAALRREIQIKGLTKARKEALIRRRRSLLVHPEELRESWIRRMPDLGVDTVGLHPVGGENAHESLERLLALLETEEFRGLIDLARSLGLKIEYEMHAGSWLLPRGEFDAHPQWQRVDREGNRSTSGNFCVSQPEALDYVCDRAEELVSRLYGSENRYYFWLDDGVDLRCHCEKCRNLSASDQQLTVMNAVIDRLRGKDPEAKLAFLAYHACMEPPERVKPAPGIFLEYAPINRGFDKPVREQDCTDANALEKLLAYFGAEDAKVLEYWFDNSLFSGWKKPPKPFSVDPSLVREDVSYYASLGFSNIASFACYLGEDYEELYGEAELPAFE